MSKFIFITIYLLVVVFYLYHFLASLQLNGYKISKIIDFNNHKFVRFINKNLILSLTFLLINIGLFYFSKVYLIISDTLYFIYFILNIIKNKSNYNKTPLIFTNRMIRLFLTNILINLVFYVYLSYYIQNALILLLVPIFSIITFVLLIISYCIILPFEKINNYRYIVLAKKRFNKKNLIKIGITGSYGKTSIKQILGHILESKYNVVYCKNNFNTELGLTINSKKINEDTDIFIAEMGARNKGDIKKLVNICNIDVAVITGICNQHIETFNDINKIINTKSEILVNNPTAYFNGNNKLVKQMFNDFSGKKYISFSENCYAKNIIYSCKKTEFDLVINENLIHLTTKLLGKSAVENIILCAYIAYNMGISLEEIQLYVFTLPYINHRLEVKFNGRFTIIDDSYNSNEVGVKNSLEILNLFEGKKYALVSGMVELGSLEQSTNYKLGKLLAKTCNKILLINTSQSKYILDGLFSENYFNNNILIYDSVEKCINDFNNVIEDGSALLIMSDLPSNYSR